MEFQKKIAEEMKNAMKSKNKVELETLRAIKSEILLIKTKRDGSEEITDLDGIKIIQKLVKQRRDSIDIFTKEKRIDLVEIEKKQIDVLVKFLPKQLSQQELEEYLKKLIKKLNIENIKDLGKAIGVANKELEGRSDGKTISETLKKIIK